MGTLIRKWRAQDTVKPKYSYARFDEQWTVMGKYDRLFRHSWKKGSGKETEWWQGQRHPQEPQPRNSKSQGKKARRTNVTFITTITTNTFTIILTTIMKQTGPSRWSSLPWAWTCKQSSRTPADSLQPQTTAFYAFYFPMMISYFFLFWCGWPDL